MIGSAVQHQIQFHEADGIITGRNGEFPFLCGFYQSVVVFINQILFVLIPVRLIDCYASLEHIGQNAGQYGRFSSSGHTHKVDISPFVYREITQLVYIGLPEVHIFCCDALFRNARGNDLFLDQFFVGNLLSTR